MADRKRAVDYALELAMFVGMAATAYLLTKNIISTFTSSLADPEKEKLEQASRQAKANLRRLQRRHDADDDPAGGHTDASATSSRRGPRVEELVLNEYENVIAMEVVAPEDIPVGFDDIGGLEGIIEELKESVIYPLTMPHLYSHAGSLLSAPSGVLLYGPPGCGKTMLAKAVAHESGANFINLHISTLTEKWYGDSNKLVRAVFSLARKLQPAIIFIDEIDAVLGTRRSNEHEASGMVKAEFMTLWDGLTSANAQGQPARIVVLGATNRMHDIDEAILRRMPKRFAVPLPGLAERRRILQLMLSTARTDPDPSRFDLDFVARITEGMSGSDLREACRDAAMVPMRELLRGNQHQQQQQQQHREQTVNGRSGGAAAALRSIDPSRVRPIRSDDFFPRIGAATNRAAQNVAAAAAAVEARDRERERDRERIGGGQGQGQEGLERRRERQAQPKVVRRPDRRPPPSGPSSEDDGFEDAPDEAPVAEAVD